MNKLGYVLVGAVGGIVLVVACGRGAGNAKAAPSDCATWQVADLEDQSIAPGVDGAIDMPAGWEPFVAYGGSVTGQSSFYVRRCKP